MNGVVSLVGVTFSHKSALDVLRAARVACGEEGVPYSITDLIEPPYKAGVRWTVPAVRELKCNVRLPLGEPVDILVSSPRRRIRTSGVLCHVWNGHVPGDSFIRIGTSEHAIPSPEVLLIQMAETLSLSQLVTLGHELCGRYTLRSSNSPGPAVIGISPVTTVTKIAELMHGIRGLHGIAKLRKALPYICDNSYSPIESCLSTMAQLPLNEFGYQMGDVILNLGIEPDVCVSDYVQAKLRRPDILFRGTRVGINYDGEVHLDLSQALTTVLGCAEDHHGLELSQALDEVLKEAQGSVAADKQRDRDLMTMGYYVLPATKFDLSDIDSLDRLMGQAMALIERTCSVDFSLQREALTDASLKEGRGRILEELKRA